MGDQKLHSMKYNDEICTSDRKATEDKKEQNIKRTDLCRDH